MKYTPLRMHLVATMLAQPDGEWTARSMRDALPAEVDATLAAVLDTFYYMMSERLAEPVPFQSALTILVRSDPHAPILLRRLMESWHGHHSDSGDTGKPAGREARPALRDGSGHTHPARPPKLSISAEKGGIAGCAKPHNASIVI